jgi:tetratricopeptide (TPR) repeat protein
MRLHLAWAYLVAGRLDEAAAAADRALALARERSERGVQAHALWTRGDVARQRDPGAPEVASASLREALALAEELGMRPLIAHCHLGLARTDRRTGKREQAQEHLRIATKMYREMDMRFWLEQAEVELEPRGQSRMSPPSTLKD